ncbi:uncharacterized protein [Lepeophtheirus salmonis]|uniref:uncharacterized protein n=1 Tax=Lepeophtheirus salmonis TaxID=72036 RepID=UPI001AE358A5|nr:uncharacterized protein LOC121120129 [Lepeophtheirus salmonis]XP_040570907.1 uncharacterized protein LOC121120129 [Lepeophtheirus salmonis]
MMIVIRKSWLPLPKYWILLSSLLFLSCNCLDYENFTFPSTSPDSETGDWESLSQYYNSHLPHRRDKRFIWLTKEKRIVFPPGTQFVITPTLAMPLIRWPPPGVDSNFTLSTPFTIGMDAMGLTDNSHPLGLLPFLNPSLGFFGKRRRRDVPEPNLKPHEIPGGERFTLYQMAEEMLFKFGLEGKSCLLRAICEMHESPLLGYGFFGEMIELFLTASKSPYSKLMEEYIEAEHAGRYEGECWKYFKNCTTSMFKVHNKYSKEAQLKHNHPRK